MICFFGDLVDTRLVDLVRDAIVLVNPALKLETVQLPREEYPSFLEESAKFAQKILAMQASVIDADVGPIVSYIAEFGSLAANREPGYKSALTFDLDRRILLVTRSEPNKGRHRGWLRYYCGKYYTILSLSVGSRSVHLRAIRDWLVEALDATTPKVFISYRSPNKVFARRLALSLKRRGASVWFDEDDIQLGESIPRAIEKGLAWCTHAVFIIDEMFLESSWTRVEYDSVVYRSLTNSGAPLILPLFLVAPELESVPPILAHTKGIDCRGKVLHQIPGILWRRIRP